MSTLHDLADELAVVRDGHAQQEERCACVQLVQQVEQVRRLAFEHRVRPIPVGEAEPPVDELMPVLEVDREQELWLLHKAGA